MPSSKHVRWPAAQLAGAPPATNSDVHGAVSPGWQITGGMHAQLGGVEQLEHPHVWLHALQSPHEVVQPVAVQLVAQPVVVVQLVVVEHADVHAWRHPQPTPMPHAVGQSGVVDVEPHPDPAALPPPRRATSTAVSPTFISRFSFTPPSHEKEDSRQRTARSAIRRPALQIARIARYGVHSPTPAGSRSKWTQIPSPV